MANQAMEDLESLNQRVSRYKQDQLTSNDVIPTNQKSSLFVCYCFSSAYESNKSHGCKKNKVQYETIGKMKILAILV